MLERDQVPDLPDEAIPTLAKLDQITAGLDDLLSYLEAEPSGFRGNPEAWTELVDAASTLFDFRRAVEIGLSR